MEEIRYYPLVDLSDDGTVKQPMFPVPDLDTVRKSHRRWLTEAVTGCFRLCSEEPLSAGELASLRIRCPRCGKEMERITLLSETSFLPLYLCEDCHNVF